MTRLRVALVVALVALATAAPIVAASSHSALVVGSIHTTDADFSAATELTNIFVEGSGTGATAELDQGSGAYNPVTAVGDGVAGPGPAFIGDGGGDVPIESEFRITPDFTGEVTSIHPNKTDISVSDYGFVVDVYMVEEQPDSTSGEGTLVKDDWDPDSSAGVETIQLDQGYPVSEGVDYTIEFVTQSSDGDGANDNAHIRYDDSTTYSNGIRSTDFDTDNPADILVEADVTGVPSSGRYVGSTHSVETASQAFIDVSLTDAHADYRIEYGGGPWSVADSGTLSSTGNHTIDISGHPDQTQWRANVTLVNETTAATTAEIHDEGIQFVGHAPTVDNASASPTSQLSSPSTTLEIQANDTDFPLAQSDDLTATWYVDGSQDGTTSSITSNGTITHSVSGLDGGTHTWRVEVEDDYGLQTTSDTFTFSVPDELRIYNESAPDTLIQNAEVEVQFFAGDGSVHERTTTNGVVDFSGLPLDQPFVVSVSADGWHSRTVYIESLIEQQEVYLLNSTTEFGAETATVVYSLTDNTGDYTPPEETTLFVEKPLTKSGSTEYRTVTSDQFSATNEMVATLEDDQRYRLRLEGPDGSTRVLRSYRTAGDDSATLTVGEVSFSGASASNPSFHAAVRDVEGTRSLRITYYDPSNATDALTIEAVNRSDASDVIRPATTETGPFGRYSEVIPLSSSADHVSFNVTYTAERTDFADQSGMVFVGDLPPIATDLNVDPEVLSALGFVTVFAVLGLTAIARPRFAGIPTVVVAIGLTTLGVMVIHPLLLAGAGVIALLFAVGGAR